jgi:hypothetical protein
MDVDCARINNRGGQNNWRGRNPNNRGGAQGNSWHRNNAYANQTWVDSNDSMDLNAVQAPPPVCYCYECGQAGHFKQECPQIKRCYNANLVDFDSFQDDPEQHQEKPVKRVARLHAEIDAMSDQEKASMLDQFGESQDFSST